MTTIAIAQSPNAAPGDRLIERFMPHADLTERHEVIIRAPAELVFEVAEQFQPALHSTDPRDLLAAREGARRHVTGGGPVCEGPRGRDPRFGVGRAGTPARPRTHQGAAAQPWKANVTFTPIPPQRFADFAEPDLVKIVWTIEAEPLRPDLTRFRTETRVLATDADAGAKFRRYWRVFGVGIVLIRWLLMPALRREAERRATRR